MAYLNNKRERVERLHENDRAARVHRSVLWTKRGFLARFSGECAVCHDQFPVGAELVSWDRKNKRYAEKTCVERLT